MTDKEQKKKLQFDAGIPHLPTDLTYECRLAIAGEGERAYDWSDKPHRLVYDLSRQVEADAIRIEELVKGRERLLRAMTDNCVIALELEAKLEKAVEALREIAVADFLDVSFAQSRSAIPIARAVLAELEGK